MSWELAIGRWGVQLSVGLGHLSRYLEGRVTVLFPEVGDGGDGLWRLSGSHVLADSFQFDLTL